MGTDELTGLADRLRFLDLTASAIREPGGVAIVALDIDRFRATNDAFGETACDEVLATFAERLRCAAGPTAVVARVGGDAFAVLCRAVRAERDALAAANRLLDAIEPAFAVGENSIVLTASVGVVHSRRGDDCAQALLGAAEAARTRARNQGGRRLELFDAAMGRQAIERARLEQDLRQALERDELVVVYQPVVSLDSGQVAGVEALVRWRHPTRGLLAPASFVPLAEESGLIVDVGRAVLDKACRQLARWSADPGITVPWLSVNVAGRQLADPAFPHELERVLAATAAPAEQLRLEVTEAVLMAQTASPAGVLDRFQQLGVGLCLHDFGATGSSLAALRNVRIDAVKLDRSFIAGITESEVDRRILAAVVDIGQALGVQVIAEGIESENQANCVTATGCALGQGYLHCRPCRPDALEPLLRRSPVHRTAAPPDRRASPAAEQRPAEPGLTVQEAAAALSVSTSTLRRWADTGRMQSTRTAGGHRRVPVAEVRRLRDEGVGGQAVAVRLMPLPEVRLPLLAAVLRDGCHSIADGAGRLVYETDRPGWLARPEGRAAVAEWLAALAEGADAGRLDRAVEATRSLLRRSDRAAVPLLERLTLVDRTAVLTARALDDAGAPDAELVAARRLFARVRQVVAEYADG